MISVIIPTHNRAHLIARSIHSVIAQTYQNWELIIVDDGSTDDSMKVIQPFLKDPRITYVWKKNSGAAHSRNEGVKIAQGKYVTFLDSDDEAYPEWLKSFFKALKNKNKEVKLICCSVDYFNSEVGKIIKSEPHEKLLFYPGIRSKFLGGAFLLPRDIFNRIGGYDPELASGQHTELGLRLIPELKGEDEIVIIEESLIRVHIHGGENIRSSHAAKYKGAKRMLSKYSDKFNEVPVQKSIYESVVAYNASKLGLKKEALKYSIAAMVSKPSPKKFLAIFKYGVF